MLLIMTSYNTLILVVIKCALIMVDTHNNGENGVLGEEWWPTGAFHNCGTSREQLHLKSKMEVKMKLTRQIDGLRLYRSTNR